ncbi:hypothetical protein [Solimicrobium silvestre]|uniref:Uncharacterized protein n=1 Tax=Solimicrobium silvestre TaxID=2099400 RepID=A0A2S9GY57_9BURK|nr:hypothetical protein [Solimicrobium silvestre]PRC92649.1 hypothetical protein S2091_2704 [Solimicrobium silvestre]
MSAFIVFGMNEDQKNLAVARAKKAISGLVKRTEKTMKRELTEEEYSILLNEELPIYILKAFKPVSAPLSAPQFCRDYIAAAKVCKFDCEMKIMMRGTITKIVKRKRGGAVEVSRMGWVEYRS